MRPAPNREFAAELRALRLRLGLTLAEAAARAQVGRTTLMAWETATSAPSPEGLVRLLDALRAEPRTRAAVLAELAPALAADPVLGPSIGAGEILRAMRVRRGLTQSALARAMGVSQGTVAKWESGDSVPGGEADARLMATLGALPGEAEALRRGGPANGALTLEVATQRLISIVHEVPEVAKEPWLLAHEAELWRRAVRDPRWEPLLVETMSFRSGWLLLSARPSESYTLARRAVALMQRCGAWNEGVLAMSALAYQRKEDELHDFARIEAFLERVSDPQRRAYMIFSTHGNRHAERSLAGVLDRLCHAEDETPPTPPPDRLFKACRQNGQMQRAFILYEAGNLEAADRIVDEEAPEWSAEGGRDAMNVIAIGRRLDWGVSSSDAELRIAEAHANDPKTIAYWRGEARRVLWKHERLGRRRASPA